MGKPPKSVLIQAFRDTDKDDNGYLELDELYALMLQYGDDEITKDTIDAFLADYDLDQDGKISFDEYMEFLNNVYMGEDDEDFDLEAVQDFEEYEEEEN